MKVETKISVYKILDYIPVASTVTNLIHLFQKMAFKKGVSNSNDNYKLYVIDKSKVECVLLLLPGFGNVIVAFIRLTKRGTVRDDTKKSQLAQGHIESFKHDIKAEELLNKALEIKDAEGQLQINADSPQLNLDVASQYFSKWFEKNPMSETMCPLLNHLSSTDSKMKLLITSMHLEENHNLRNQYLYEMARIELLERCNYTEQDALVKIRSIGLGVISADIVNELKDVQLKTTTKECYNQFLEVFNSRLEKFYERGLEIAGFKKRDLVKNSDETINFNASFVVLEAYLKDDLNSSELAFRNLAAICVLWNESQIANEIINLSKVTKEDYLKYIKYHEVIYYVGENRVEEAESRLKELMENKILVDWEFVPIGRILYYALKSEDYKNVLHYSSLPDFCKNREFSERNAILLHTAKAFVDAEDDISGERVVAYLIQSCIEYNCTSRLDFSINSQYHEDVLRLAKNIFEKSKEFMNLNLDEYYKKFNDHLLEIISKIMDEAGIFNKYLNN